MSTENHKGSNVKWIIQYVIVPIVVAFIGAGAGTAVIVSNPSCDPSKECEWKANQGVLKQLILEASTNKMTFNSKPLAVTA